MKRRARALWRWIALLAVLAIGGQLAAQEAYPRKPIRIIVPYEAGGGTDKLARVLAQRLQDRLGQSVIVENKAGAATNLGNAFVAHAEPDGYTLLMAGTPFAINQSLFRKLPFDPQKLQPITLVAITPNVLLVHPSVPARNLAELVAYGKANPGKLYFSSSGVGSSLHLAGEMLKAATGLQMSHVSYKGSSQAMVDVLAGRVQMTFATMISGVPYVNSGQLRALAITPKRSPALPDVPSFAESGFPGIDVAGWYGVLTPTGTPAAVVARLSKELTTALHDPAIVGQFAADGIDVVGSSPEEFGAFLKEQVAKWGLAVKESGALSD